jgi:hypothetical protein
MKAFHYFDRLVRGLFLLTIFVFLGASTLFAGSVVSVSASPTQITDEGQEAIFTIHASPAPLSRIAVNFVMTGTAILGQDYALSGNFRHGQIVIEPGTTSTPITLHSFDGDGFFRRTATLNIIGRTSPRSHATVRIKNVP